MKKFSADKLNSLINERGITAKELSKATKIGEDLICHYRSGHRSPGLTNAALLADYFNTTVDELLTGET